jgi:hypothetical protein
LIALNLKSKPSSPTVNAVLGVITSELLKKQIVRLLLDTTLWWLFTGGFDWLLLISGSCSESTLFDIRSCKRAGHSWSGMDISGHCFLLLFSTLVLTEEYSALLPAYEELFRPASRQSKPLSVELNLPVWNTLLVQIAHYLIIALRLLWIFMMAITSLYYHTFLDKMLGLAFAYTSWKLVYGYLLPSSQ